MPLAAPAVDVTTATAARNWRANRAAMTARQPDVADALDGSAVGTTWAMARDGSVAARDAAGQWAGGCSVPLLAGRTLLGTLSAQPGGAVLLAPAHAGLLAAARERLGPAAVLFVLQPESEVVRAMLGCVDVSADLAAGRLWIAVGDDWARALRAAFDDHDGLAAPTRFVRTRLNTDAEIDPLVETAQRVFGDVATARAARLEAVLDAPAAPAGPVVIVGSAYQLWDPSPALASVVANATVYDPSDPLTAASLAFARATRGCSAVIAVGIGRGDAAAVVPLETPWITWAVTAALPAVESAGPCDQLILADPNWMPLARAAGWPAERVRVGRCPTLVKPTPPPVVRSVSILADTRPVTPPAEVRLYSSQLLLWEAIEAELRDDPGAVNDAYLTDRARRMNIDPVTMDRARFTDDLIGPAYVQGIARVLLTAGVPVQLWGQGWDEVPEFADHARGPITTADDFARAVRNASALVRPVPGSHWHPVVACGRPVIDAAGASRTELVRRAGAAVTATPRPGPTVTLDLATALRGALDRINPGPPTVHRP